MRVYHEDTDGGGIVYYANYLKFMERARTEYLREMGVEQTDLLEQHRCLMVVKNVTVNYIRPAVFNDRLLVTCEPASVKRASFVVRQQVIRVTAGSNQHEDREVVQGTSDTVLVDGQVMLATLAADTLTATRIPAPVLSVLQPSG